MRLIIFFFFFSLLLLFLLLLLLSFFFLFGKRVGEGMGWEGMGGTVGVIADGKRVWVPSEAGARPMGLERLAWNEKVQHLGVV